MSCVLDSQLLTTLFVVTIYLCLDLPEELNLCYFFLFTVTIPFFIGSELFLQGPRSTVAGLGALTNRVSNYIIAISFPHVVVSHVTIPPAK